MKKILPKTAPALTAESLEASFQKSASAIPTVSIPIQTVEKVQIEKPVTKIVEKKAAEKPKPVLQKVVEVPVTEGVAKSSKRDGRSRISIDIPDELFAKIEENKEETGQTMTHLVVSLLKKHFAAKS